MFILPLLILIEIEWSDGEVIIMKKIALVSTPESLAYSLMGPLDVLRSSGMVVDEETGQIKQLFLVELVAETSEMFECFNGIKLHPDADVNGREQYDLIWIPSLVLGEEGLLTPHKKIQSWIRQQVAGGASVASVCTGAFLLAETGLLNGLKATTHWAFADLFKSKYPRVELMPHLAFLDNGPILCAGGGSAWHDMVLTVLEKYGNKRCAVEAAKMFLLQYHHNGQQHLKILQTQKKHNDALIGQAEKWLSMHVSEENLIAKVSEVLGVNESTFKRRFKQVLNIPPNAYIQKLRIDKAKEALELTQQPVEQISLMVGYQDSSFFRRLFKRETGLSPTQYRREFSNL